MHRRKCFLKPLSVAIRTISPHEIWVASQACRRALRGQGFTPYTKGDGIPSSLRQTPSRSTHGIRPAQALRSRQEAASRDQVVTFCERGRRRTPSRSILRPRAHAKRIGDPSRTFPASTLSPPTTRRLRWCWRTRRAEAPWAMMAQSCHFIAPGTSTVSFLAIIWFATSHDTFVSPPPPTDRISSG